MLPHLIIRGGKHARLNHQPENLISSSLIPAASYSSKCRLDKCSASSCCRGPSATPCICTRRTYPSRVSSTHPSTQAHSGPLEQRTSAPLEGVPPTSAPRGAPPPATWPPRPSATPLPTAPPGRSGSAAPPHSTMTPTGQQVHLATSGALPKTRTMGAGSLRRYRFPRWHLGHRSPTCRSACSRCQR